MLLNYFVRKFSVFFAIDEKIYGFTMREEKPNF